MLYGEAVTRQNWVLRAQVRGLVQQPSLAYGFAAKTNIPSCFIFQLMTSHSVPAVSSSHFLPGPRASRRLLWCWLREHGLLASAEIAAVEEPHFQKKTDSKPGFLWGFSRAFLPDFELGVKKGAEKRFFLCVFFFLIYLF